MKSARGIRGPSDAVFFSAPPESGLVDAENGGGFLKGLRVCQDPPDVLFFDLFDGDGIADLECEIARQ